MQYSVYCKMFANREAAVKHVNLLERNVPKKGQIRILLVTEKQYSKIEIIVGGKSNQEKIVNSDFFIKILIFLNLQMDQNYGNFRLNK